MLEALQLRGVASHAPGVFDRTHARSFRATMARAGWMALEVAEIRVDSLEQAFAHPWFVAAANDLDSRYVVATLDAKVARTRDRSSVYFTIFELRWDSDA